MVEAAITSARLARLTVAGLIALVATQFLWETLLAPLRPGGSWLLLKAAPLAFLVPGVARGARRSQQWLSLLLPFYLAEAIVRGWSESGRHSLVAWFAGLLAASTFLALIAWVRSEKIRSHPRGGRT
jgi:uncharacterized membrane protein